MRKTFWTSSDEIDQLPRGQYLNCEILHGGTLTQPWPNAFGMRVKFSGNCAPRSNFVPVFDWRPKKKVFIEIVGFMSSKSSEKKFFTAIWYYIRQEFGFIRTGSHFFVWSSRRLLSMERALKSRQEGRCTISMGDATSYNLSTARGCWMDLLMTLTEQNRESDRRLLPVT